MAYNTIKWSQIKRNRLFNLYGREIEMNPKITLKIIRGEMYYVLAGVAYPSMKKAMCAWTSLQE